MDHGSLQWFTVHDAGSDRVLLEQHREHVQLGSGCSYGFQAILFAGIMPGRSGALTITTTTSVFITYKGTNGTVTTGTLVSGGALGDQICLVGVDSTHYFAPGPGQGSGRITSMIEKLILALCLCVPAFGQGILAPILQGAPTGGVTFIPVQGAVGFKWLLDRCRYELHSLLLRRLATRLSRGVQCMALP